MAQELGGARARGSPRGSAIIWFRESLVNALLYTGTIGGKRPAFEAPDPGRKAPIDKGARVDNCFRPGTPPGFVGNRLRSWLMALRTINETAIPADNYHCRSAASRSDVLDLGCSLYSIGGAISSAEQEPRRFCCSDREERYRLRRPFRLWDRKDPGKRVVHENRPFPFA